MRFSAKAQLQTSDNYLRRLTYPQLRVIRRQQERGLSSAVIRGWQVSQGTILGVIDGDLQHSPEVLTQLLREMKQGADAD